MDVSSNLGRKRGFLQATFATGRPAIPHALNGVPEGLVAGCNGSRKCECFPRHSIALDLKGHAGRAFGVVAANDGNLDREEMKSKEKRWKERPHHLWDL